MRTFDGLPERRKARPGEAKRHMRKDTQEQATLAQLMASGFQAHEAVMLLTMREHLLENAEVYERIQGDARMQFAKWLYEQRMVSEE